MPPIHKTQTKPKLVNRGSAGLLKKAPASVPQIEEKDLPPTGEALWAKSKKNNIPNALKGLIVDIASLIPDSENARLHPERNMGAIKDSLAMYGQMKPVVVQKGTMVVYAGNGTLQAAKELGWTKIAANIVEMNDIEAKGYGLADNRSAELAKWDFEIVAKIDKLLSESNQASIGWSLEELQVLRLADWTPPADTGEETYAPGVTSMISFTKEQKERLNEYIDLLKGTDSLYQDKTDPECIIAICQQWKATYATDYPE